MREATAKAPGIDPNDPALADRMWRHTVDGLARRGRVDLAAVAMIARLQQYAHNLPQGPPELELDPEGCRNAARRIAREMADLLASYAA